MSLVKDTEVVLQAQLQKKRRGKIEQAGVGIAQGYLSLLTCNLSSVLKPWGKWGAPTLCKFNLLSVICCVITGQEQEQYFLLWSSGCVLSS